MLHNGHELSEVEQLRAAEAEGGDDARLLRVLALHLEEVLEMLRHARRQLVCVGLGPDEHGVSVVLDVALQGRGGQLAEVHDDLRRV